MLVPVVCFLWVDSLYLCMSQRSCGSLRLCADLPRRGIWRHSDFLSVSCRGSNAAMSAPHFENLDTLQSHAVDSIKDEKGKFLGLGYIGILPWCAIYTS